MLCRSLLGRAPPAGQSRRQRSRPPPQIEQSAGDWSLHGVCGEALLFCASEPPITPPAVLPGVTLDVAAVTLDPSAMDSDPAARAQGQAHRPHGFFLHPDLHPRPLRRQLRLHLLHHRLPPGPRHPNRGGQPRRRRRGGRSTYSCRAPQDADAGGGARRGRVAGHADGRASAGHRGEPARPPRGKEGWKRARALLRRGLQECFHHCCLSYEIRADISGRSIRIFKGNF